MSHLYTNMLNETPAGLIELAQHFRSAVDLSIVLLVSQYEHFCSAHLLAEHWRRDFCNGFIYPRAKCPFGIIKKKIKRY